MNGKKVLAITMTVVALTTLTACGGKGENKKEEQGATDITIDQIKLGEDFTDIEADLKVLTNRTDLVDTTLKGYETEFQKLYPNINIEYEAISDYGNDMTTRLTTGDWGDICMIPTTVDKDELGEYFLTLGDKSTLEKEYTLVDNYTYDGKCYGLASMANISGIVYNKAVFEKAGVTELPKTPDEFIAALQKIKDNTDAIPLYTNFGSGWAMINLDAYIDGCATGDPSFANEGLLKGKNPFSDRRDGTGPFAVYNMYYEAVAKGLTEEDPTTTDWEGSKGMLNRGEIGCMFFGSWVLPQVQQAGDNPDDIAYMPFPISVDGIQYATEGPDWYYGINVNSSSDQQIAAMCYVKWLVEKSGFAETVGGIDCVVGAKLPEALAAFESDKVKIIVNEPAVSGEEALFNDVNNDSELGLNVSGKCGTEVVENAITGDATMKELADNWNKSWTEAQEKNGITH